MKKIIHMSDLHVGCEHFDDRLKMIFDQLILQKGQEAGQYVVVISGDLVQDARKIDSFLKVKELLGILQEAGFKDVLVIPGNHDHGNGTWADKKNGENFQKIFYGHMIEFPKKDIIGDVAFIGLNSMEQELNWYDKFWAEGELGKKQLERLAEMLDCEDVKACQKRVIYLHHHPFKWRPFHELKDSKALKRVLRSAMDQGVSIDALLFGHNHQGLPHHGHWGITRCYDAGTATLKPRPKMFDKLPWFQVKASSRSIDLSLEDPAQDEELQLL